MHTNFAPIGQLQTSHSGDNSFWPSFTDIMMVITMIFLMATSLLVVRNWQLVTELRESVAAEQLAAQMIESTSQENATLEERLANAEQSNSILRLRLLKKDEELLVASNMIQQQEASIATLEFNNTELRKSLDQANSALAAANLQIDRVTTQYRGLENQVANLSTELNRQKIESDKTRELLSSAKAEIEAYKRQLLALKDEYGALLSTAKAEIESLTLSSQAQQQDISSLTQERQVLNQEIASLTQDKQLRNQEIEAYNRQLLALKGEYEVVKSKYEELVKPARTAKGKYIAEVYYIKGKSREVIRYKQPGDRDFTDLTLAEVEKRLSRLKSEQGKNLYVKIIIPQDSGLTYSEAWDFMRNLLVKYDYYYQEN